MARRRPRTQAVPVDAGAIGPAGTALGAGGLLAYAFGDARVRIWDTGRAALHHELHDHRAPVTAVATDAAGRLLASSSLDGTVRLTDLATGTPVRVLDARGEPVRAVAVAPGGAVVGLVGAAVHRWDAASGALIDVLPGTADLRRVGVTAGGHVVALGPSGAVVWDGRRPGPAVSLVVPARGPLWALTAADGTWVAVVGAGSEMRELGDDRVLSGRPGVRMQRRPSDLAVLTPDGTVVSVHSTRHDHTYELPHIGVLDWQPPKEGDPDARGYLRGLDPEVVGRVVEVVADATGTVVAATGPGELLVVEPAGEKLQRSPSRRRVTRPRRAPGDHPPHRVVDTGPTIDARVFWELVEAAGRRADRELRRADPDERAERQAELLVDLLVGRPTEEIRGFDRFFADRMDESFRWDLWAVAAIVGGGCSDDAFEYFRCWLIGQGEQYYARALRTPPDAARRIPVGADLPQAWDLRLAADRAHERLHGSPLPDPDRPLRGEPTGPAWQDPADLFPELDDRYS